MNLVEIAKSCGAQIYQLNLGREFYPVSLSMNTSKLYAYTEQVCKQMVEALERNKNLIKVSMDISLGINDPLLAALFHDGWNANDKIIAAYKQMMGDRHD